MGEKRNCPAQRDGQGRTIHIDMSSIAATFVAKPGQVTVGEDTRIVVSNVNAIRQIIEQVHTKKRRDGTDAIII